MFCVSQWYSTLGDVSELVSNEWELQRQFKWSMTYSMSKKELEKDKHVFTVQIIHDNGWDMTNPAFKENENKGGHWKLEY